MKLTILIVGLALISCAAAAGCPEVCPALYQPICAQDNQGNRQLFGSSCALGVEACKSAAKGWKKVKDGPC